jgi:hypothetical protein
MSDEAHRVTGLLRLIASLRARWALETKPLASELSLPCSVASVGRHRDRREDGGDRDGDHCPIA